MNIYPETKICTGCDTAKSLDCFSKSTKTKDGKQYRCRTCNAAAKANYNAGLRRGPKRTKLQIAEYVRNRYASDIDFRLKHVMRSRLTVAISGKYKKPGSAVRDLGCTWDHFKSHIESKFTEGMTWENYGDWHIDHIHPLAKVNCSNKEELLKAVHYTNLQPLWAIDNQRKSARLL